jgi:hypothetical protein
MFTGILFILIAGAGSISLDAIIIKDRKYSEELND